MEELYIKLKFELNKPCERLVGRSNERCIIGDFFNNYFEKGVETSSLYISGNPGTGKTALIQEFINKYNEDSEGVDSIQSTKKRKLDTNKLGDNIYYLNCTSLNSPRIIYSKLVKMLFGDFNKFKDNKLNLENLVFNGEVQKNKKVHKTINLIILDEIDQLLGRGDDNEELHQLIEWTFLPNSNLSLIGISNTLNLLERFLPKLKAKGYEPKCINFLPYNVSEIAEILKFKCKDITFEDGDKIQQPLINSKAVEFCARKVASDTGDLRRAIDLTIQTIDYALEEFNKTDKKEYIPVDINHALQVTKKLNQNTVSSQLKQLNISQQLILCSTLHLIKSNKLLKFEDIYDKYCDLCDLSELFQPITQTEYQDCLTNLESIGCISITKKKVKKLNLTTINLLTMESDITNCIKNSPELEELLPK